MSVVRRVEHRTGVAAAILDNARADAADLIAMATSAWSDLDRWLRGSVADEVLRQAEVPVFIVPPQAAETVVVTTQGSGPSARGHRHTRRPGPAQTSNPASWSPSMAPTSRCGRLILRSRSPKR